ncbi:MAG: hypothetical protein CL600_11280 [Alteromonas sp.]|uniref:hypothetical protein n=1 Tax=unclassified Alteromonas TaxID=2614992 RepID=UPI0009032785|nr:MULTISPECIES: hypothetical protein [unclassified Alteromonas]APE07282.1 hypothetical protein BM528_17090 [Alteromonas sp. RW2A1]AUC89910.1 hypothetical protein CW735_18385 [Alteromonas sp. MB-3u-76]MAI65439.1 hypothetical protein [Alteromonas sp.]
MLYHILGTISAVAFLLTWYGLAKQIISIEKLRSSNLPPTKSLSTNQFASSFLAFYSNFIFGIAIEPLSHYLVWTRFGAILLVLVILFQIWRDRRSLSTGFIFSFCAVAVVVGVCSIGFRPYPGLAKLGATTLMLIVTALLVQGTLHQLFVIRRSQVIGALSPALFQSILIKDVTTLAFAFTMPFAIAWPLILLNGASVITRGCLLIQMVVITNKSQL